MVQRTLDLLGEQHPKTEYRKYVSRKYSRKGLDLNKIKKSVDMVLESAKLFLVMSN